ncbi:MAG: hypothetical protein ACYDH6_20325 [Acidimicrobiales bacterium]
MNVTGRPLTCGPLSTRTLTVNGALAAQPLPFAWHPPRTDASVVGGTVGRAVPVGAGELVGVGASDVVTDARAVMDRATADEALVDEGPVDDGPVDDGPVDEGPVDEGPVDEPSREGDPAHAPRTATVIAKTGNHHPLRSSLRLTGPARRCAIVAASSAGRSTGAAVTRLVRGAAARSAGHGQQAPMLAAHAVGAGRPRTAAARPRDRLARP